MPLIRTVSGMRGIVGQDLDARVVCRHALAFAALQPPGPILLARDSRPHGPGLLETAAQALVHAHRRVVPTDLAPTPTAQFLVPHKNLAGAIVMTASHNPVEYNGMKFIGSDGCFLSGEEMKILFSRADQTDVPEHLSSRRVSGHGLIDAVGLHILDVLDLSCIDTGALLRRRFRVVVDAVNAAASFALPMLLRALSCEVVAIHCTPDGTFPREPEPLPENLGDLCSAVVAHDAQVGMAADPDGDRLALVDETGTPLGEDLTQVLAVDGFLRRTASRKPVTTNLSSSMLLDHAAGRYGVEVLRSAVGEVNVVNLMRSVGGEIGGEGNGGVILAESHLGRDALVGAALVLDRMSQEDKPLSAIRAELPGYQMVKDKVSIEGRNADDILQQLAGRFSDAEQNTDDGLKLQWEDRWVHIRVSNTEPIIRIIAEGPTEDNACDLVNSVKEIME